MSELPDDLTRYIPHREWFDRQDDRSFAGTHGIGHITRVIVWANQIASRVTEPVRRTDLLYAAGFHDIKRWDDGKDRGHGSRAATWVTDEPTTVAPAIASEIDVSFVATLIRYHEITDQNIPTDDWSIELRILKDADGLDRVRIFDLDPSRLRLQTISPALEPLARQLMRESLRRGNTADAVRSVVQEMNLWE